ncbi:unnamed protein product [Didymodactylos carnosus]|uniref:Uncharacterized protein n=1 Tax=Didymodactylos carnosus TaxID=1234261 RepID=A0A814IP54_9BILA|nr:unnamed protein product [Didymodactylos carnosus]CAF3795533.1 unnamed protein product [Didymodactylos carnosus]
MLLQHDDLINDDEVSKQRFHIAEHVHIVILDEKNEYEGHSLKYLYAKVFVIEQPFHYVIAINSLLLLTISDENTRNFIGAAILFYQLTKTMTAQLIELEQTSPTPGYVPKRAPERAAYTIPMNNYFVAYTDINKSAHFPVKGIRRKCFNAFGKAWDGGNGFQHTFFNGEVHLDDVGVLITRYNTQYGKLIDSTVLYTFFQTYQLDEITRYVERNEEYLPTSSQCIVRIDREMYEYKLSVAFKPTLIYDNEMVTPPMEILRVTCGGGPTVCFELSSEDKYFNDNRNLFTKISPQNLFRSGVAAETFLFRTSRLERD